MIGVGFFRPYTIDSNILMGIIATIYLMYFIRKMLAKREIPIFVSVLYLIGTVSVVLTFLVVIFFLVPMNFNNMGIVVFFSGNMFFFHFLNPVLSVTCFFMLERKNKFVVRDNFLSLVPTIIYSVIYIVNVVFTKKWKDFYGFTFGGNFYLSPIVVVVMYTIVYLISFTLTKIKNNKTNKLVK